MYCPSCGADADERQPSQYCRACGFDLRGVRQTLERPDSITDSAISARQQISLAIAEKIKEVETGDDLKDIVEEVLPQIEKFLESPEERRLRRIRAGLITTSIGFGASLGALFMTITDEDFVIFLLPTLVLFFIGLGLMINGLWFTLPRKQLPDADRNLLSPELIDKSPRRTTKNIPPTYAPLTNSSVTEHTTHHLRDKDVR